MKKNYATIEEVNNIFSWKTIKNVSGLEEGSGDITITFTDDSYITMYHSQDCCESVSVEDISGATDLTNSQFYEIIEKSCDLEALNEYDESFTWTFYTLVTSKGYTDIRWYGTSNGYYSESVDFMISYNEKETK